MSTATAAASRPSAAWPTTVDVVAGLQQRGQAGADHRVVVDHHDADHGADSGSMTSRQCVPAPGRDATWSTAPASLARSPSTRRPKCPSCGESRTAGVEARSVVEHVEHHGAVLAPEPDRRGARSGVLGAVAQALLRDPVDQPLLVLGQAEVVGPLDVDLDGQAARGA